MRMWVLVAFLVVAGTGVARAEPLPDAGWRLLQWLPDGSPELRRYVGGWLGIAADAPLPELEVLRESDHVMLQISRAKDGPFALAYTDFALPRGLYTAVLEARTLGSEPARVDVVLGTERRSFQVGRDWETCEVSADFPYYTDDCGLQVHAHGFGITQVRVLRIDRAPARIDMSFDRGVTRLAAGPGPPPEEVTLHWSLPDRKEEIEAVKWQAPSVTVRARPPGSWVWLEARWTSGAAYLSPEVEVPDLPPRVSVALVEPSYRNQRATGEPIQLMVRVGPGDPAPLEVSLRDRSGQVVQRQVLAAPGQFPVELDGSSLSPGTYFVEATCGWDVARLTLRIVAPSSQAWDVRDGVLRRNGRPWLPLGLYHVHRDLSVARGLGLNLAYAMWRSPRQVSRLAENAIKDGIDLILERTFDLDPQQIPQQLERMVADGRGLPLLAWTVVDEPDLSSRRAAIVQDAYDRLAALDPYHPVYTTNHTVASFRHFAPATDVLAPDPYPIGIAPRPIWLVAYAMDRARDACGPDRCVMLVDQAFALYPFWRAPTPQEERCMTYLALNHGARGIFFYAEEEILNPDSPDFKWHLKDTPLFEAIRRLAAELESLADVLTSNAAPACKVEAVGDDGRLDVGLWGYQSATYAVVVNVTRQLVHGTFKLDKSGSVLEYLEHRTVSRSVDAFEDDFPALGVHVYRIE